MPAMIETCPGCGKRGIMKKSTKKCVRCSNGAAPKVTISAIPPVTVTPVPTHAPAPARTHASPSAKPTRSAARRLVGGRLV